MVFSATLSLTGASSNSHGSNQWTSMKPRDWMVLYWYQPIQILLLPQLRWFPITVKRQWPWHWRNGNSQQKGDSNPASININKWGIFIPYISPAIRPRRAPAQSPKRRNTARVSDGITTLLPVEPSFPFEMGPGVSWSQIKGIHIHIIHPIRGNSWNYRPGKNMSLRIQLLPCTHRFYWNG